MNGQTQLLSKTLKCLLSSPAANATSPFRHLPPSSSINGAKTISIEKWQSCLYQCANSKCIPTTQQLHGYTVTSGLHLSSNSSYLFSLLASAYALGGQTSVARDMFDVLPLQERAFFSYKTMIRMYIEDGYPRKAVELFHEMHKSGSYEADSYIYPFVIRACGNLLMLKLGVSVHGLALKSGWDSDGFIGNSLLAMYMKCGDHKGAKRVFENMENRTTVSWNTMISGYIRVDNAKESLVLFRKLLDGGYEVDSATVVSVLPACGILKDLDLGREVHLLVEEKGFGKRLSARNALVDMYVKCGRLDEARIVFDQTVDKDVVTWTTMIHGYILNGDATSALHLCRLMQFECIKPNDITLSSLLASCSSLPNLKLGKCLHGWAMRHGMHSNVSVETALIDLYAKCKIIILSLRVFSMTSKKETVPWNAILSGCIHNELAREAIELFKQMLSAAVKPNDATLKCLLPAYALGADMQQAKSIHSYLIRSGFISWPEIATGLVDAYCKSGSLWSGHNVFNGMELNEKDIVLWSALIDGYGTHGDGEVAVSLFYEMVQSGVKPNEVTFTSVLRACSHAGLVDDGLGLFNFIHGSYPDCLRTDHYTCMVDLLGRGGRLNEAHELIRSMPFAPSHAVWGALLGACVIHQNVELAEVAANWLFELEPENTGNYVLMGNIYAAVGRWKDVEGVRCKMDRVGLLKSPAQSFVEVR